MNESWWELPYISWPVGWFLGVFSSLFANWLINYLHKKKYKNKEYFNMSFQENVMTFEGKQKININSKDFLSFIFKNEDSDK